MSEGAKPEGEPGAAGEAGAASEPGVGGRPRARGDPGGRDGGHAEYLQTVSEFSSQAAPPGGTSLGLEPDLDPETARRPPGGPASLPSRSAPPIDTRRYRWTVGAVGLIVVIVFSIALFLRHGVVTAGVPAHARLRYFAAPLARTNLNGDANVANPDCSPARHDPRALNLCLLVRRGPVVLAFFVADARPCTRAVDAMQALSLQIPSVQFAAVAVNASHAAVARAVRSHGWTIPVAYDADGAVGYQYGVQVCPLIELAYRGGIVEDRLIGEDWARPAALAGRVRALLASAPG